MRERMSPKIVSSVCLAGLAVACITSTSTSAPLSLFLSCPTVHSIARDAAECLPHETTTPIRALCVFVRMTDDNVVDWSDSWPIDTTITDTTFVQFDAVPAWADTLCEIAGTSLPSIDGSLRDYYHLMSRGKFDFDSAYYDSVVVPGSIEEYVTNYGEDAARDSVLAHALDAVAADASFDLKDFVSTRTDSLAATPDTLDFVMFVLRGQRAFGGSSCSVQYRLNPTNSNGEQDLFERTLVSAHDTLTYFVAEPLTAVASGLGSRVDSSVLPNPVPAGGVDCTSCTTCPTMGLDLRSFRSTIVHEIGHALFQPLEGVGIAHFYTLNDWSVMHANGRGAIMHGWERWQLGWIDPIRIDSPDEATITLYDAVSRNAPSFGVAQDSTHYVIYSDVDSTQYFLLENRRASTVYAEDWEPNGDFSGVGQPGSGLLITHYNDTVALADSYSFGLVKDLNIETAYGAFDLDFEPDSEAGRTAITSSMAGRNKARADDTFGPGRNNTFAPYTNPSTAFYDATDAVQNLHTGLALLDIREGADSSVVADLKWNQPADSTVGNVTWDGQVLLQSDFVISEGDTVTVTEDARVLMRGPDDAGSGAGVDPTRVELAVRGDGYLNYESGLFDEPVFASARDTTLRIGPDPGEVPLLNHSIPGGIGNPDTLLVLAPPAPGVADWYGIRLPGTEALSNESARLKHARVALAFETDEAPDFTAINGTHGLLFTDNYVHVGFDRDVVVPAGSTLVIPSGWNVGFAADRDEANVGLDSGRVELIVYGDIDFRGNSFYDRVRLLSDDPDTTDSNRTGDWWGMRLEQAPAVSGKCGDDRELDFTLFRDAIHGIAVLDSCSGDLNWPLFENNRDSDIYLGRDVTIPEDRFWDLRSPTRVVAEADSTINQISPGDDEKTDLIVRGKLVTRTPGVVDSTEQVFFTATEEDSTTADAWGGVYVDYTATETTIEDANLGFAPNPLFVYGADGTNVEHCEFHHYRTAGIWTESAGDITIRDSQFERGEGLNSLLGDRGVYIKSGTPWVYGNDVAWHRTAGIQFLSTKSDCETDPASADSLHVHKNDVDGSDSADPAPTPAGIDWEWACGTTNRTVLSEENYVHDWEDWGVSWNQSVDVQVECDSIVDNLVGVALTRNTSASGPPVRYFSSSVVLPSGPGSSGSCFVTDNALKLRLGGAITSDRGKNVIAVADTASKFIVHTCGSDTLDARSNFWFIGGSATVDTTEIRPKVVSCVNIESPQDPGAGNVNIPICIRPASSVQTQVLVGGRSPDGRDSAGLSSRLVPTVTFVGKAVPTPFSGETSLELALAGDQVRRVVATVYDVAGRVVDRPYAQELVPGRYTITWNGRTASGERVTTGVYFMRVEIGSDRVETRRMVLLK